jgi:hypothetical protein
MPHWVFEKFQNVVSRVTLNQTLRVSMLGPSGVGKSSMLATMYEQLDNVIVQTDLQVSPDDPADAQLLDSKVLALRRLFATDDLIPDASAGLKGDTDWRSYTFAIGRRGRRPTLRMEFFDYPGGWIEDDASTEQRDFVQKLLRDSDAILIPIDAPALMEKEGRWHYERNRPDFIFHLIQEAYVDLQLPRLVILAPIRCELYLQHPKHEAIMLERVQWGYDKLLRHLSFGNFPNLIAVVVTPIQTLGEIVFHQNPKTRYAPFFMKTQPDAQYCPRDSEQPLRYVLRYAMRLHQDHRQVGYFDFIRRLFRNDEYLLAAATSFAAGCKSTGAFSILQGHDWLGVVR